MCNASPRWRYETHDPHSPDAWAQTDDSGLDTVVGYRRIDNITDWCLQQFRAQYPTLPITKDDIWHYVYGLLHASDYRERYRADLSKDLPRIPFAPDFGVFRDAGAALAALHLGYETCPEYELLVDINGTGDSVYRLTDKKMQWGGTRKEPESVCTACHPRGHAARYSRRGPRLCGQRTHAVGVGGRPTARSPRQRERHRQRSQRLVRGQSGWPGVASAPPGTRERGDNAHRGRIAYSIAGLKQPWQIRLGRL